jgi:DNA-binding NarL/FixJ family response regulator
MIHIGIIEDESIMLASLCETFTGSPDMKVALATRTVEDFIKALDAEDFTLDLLLLDINLPGKSGLEGIPLFRERRPDLDIIMLTNMDDADHIFPALRAGAVSYISKKKVNPPILREAVVTVNRGGSYMSPGIARKVMEHFAPKLSAPQTQQTEARLTPRQHEIVALLTMGKSYKVIADDLGISVETVRDHIKHIYRELQVHSKAEVILKKLGGEI